MKPSEKRSDADILLRIITADDGHTPPDCDTLGKWLRQEQCPPEALRQAHELMKYTTRDGISRHLANINTEGDTVWVREGGKTEVISITDLAERWKQISREERREFPIAPVALAWMRRVRKIKIDDRDTAIIPQTARITGYGQLAMELAQPPQLGFMPYNTDDQANAHLPEMESMDETSIISPTLLMYDAVHMPPEKGGHGAPLSLRIWNEAVMAMPVHERSQPGQLAVPARELAQWLWPYGVFRPGRHLPDMIKGLQAVNFATTPWKHGRWSAVTIRNYPQKAEDPVVFDVSLPPGSGQGPLIHRGVLRHYGVAKAGLYRAYLCITYIWDEYGTQNGKRTQTSRPRVVRDEEGYILDLRGRRVPGRNGRPVRNWNHPAAVRLEGREANPSASCYPIVTEQELGRLFHSGSRDKTPKLNFKARSILDQMAEDGIINHETGLRTHTGEPAVRILPPEHWGPGWNPPKGFIRDPGKSAT